MKIRVCVPGCLNELERDEMLSCTQLDRIARTPTTLTHPIQNQLAVDEESAPVVRYCRESVLAGCKLEAAMPSRSTRR